MADLESWSKSTNRTMRGGRANPGALQRGENGRVLCRWCKLEVPAGRRTFCSDWCVHEWRLRSDPGYLRERVFQRDKGVCAACGLDTEVEWRRLKRLPASRRLGVLRDWGIRTLRRASLWDADHIAPVAEGGGECDLSNLRTLCLRCHRKATAELRMRLRLVKSESSEQQD
jgi:5-methylcytosine-specific restriction endonuclease McrA